MELSLKCPFKSYMEISCELGLEIFKKMGGYFDEYNRGYIEFLKCENGIDHIMKKVEYMNKMTTTTLKNLVKYANQTDLCNN